MSFAEQTFWRELLPVKTAIKAPSLGQATRTVHGIPIIAAERLRPFLPSCTRLEAKLLGGNTRCSGNFKVEMLQIVAN